MNYFQVERFPDAMRTTRRLAICFVAAMICVVALRKREFAGYDPVLFQQLLKFEHAFNSGVALAIASIAVAVFTAIQAESRNPFADEGELGWLSIHGWEGSFDKLPQRGLLPISELIGMLLFTFAMGQITPAAFLFLPMTWSAIRLSYCWPSSNRDHAIRVVWLLHATVILWSRTLWAAVLIELFAIVLTEWVMADALSRKAKDLINHNVTLLAKYSTSASKPQSLTRRRALKNLVGKSLYPFAQLSAEVEVSSPSWTNSIWTATIFAWWMFCLATRVSDLDTWMNPDERRFASHLLIGIGSTFVIAYVGLMRMMTYGPFTWTPRLGLIARIQLLRPIVWSWDRILFPHLLTFTLVYLSSLFREYMTPLAFAVFVFIELLILLRVGPTTTDWQMTSDARLTSSFLPTGGPDDR